MRVAIYARVSTDRGEQNPEVQLYALRRWLEALGHEVAGEFVDRMSGTKRDRPELQQLLDRAAGLWPVAPFVPPEALRFDAVAVVKLDRLARSTKDLIEIAELLERAEVDLLVKDQAIDTSTPAGKLMFHVLAAIAEFERDLIAERTRAGLDHARAQGVRLGRPPRLARDRAERELEACGGNRTRAASALGVSRSVFGRALLRA